MSRFGGVSLFAALILAGGLIGLEDPARGWVCAAVLLAWLGVMTAGVSFIQLELFGPALCRGRSGRMRVALTFDDGPDPASTPQLLELLREHRVAATFFCVGQRVSAAPDLVRRMVSEGHLVGNHSFRHAWWTNFLFGRWLSAELEAAQQAIAGAVGEAPALFRSPMGLTNPHLRAGLARAGLTLVGWDVRSFDRNASSAQAVIARVTSRVRDGSIILMHDGGVSGTMLVDIVRGVILELHARGFRFVRVDEMLEP